jgi:AraC-like DNA-binding protein
MHPAAELASTWNISPGSAELLNGKSLTAARWRHSFSELGDMVAPANILVYRNKPTRAWRVRGKNAEQMTSKDKGVALLAQGSYGSWRYLDSVDITHIYVKNDFLADLSVQEGGSANVALREFLDLTDPLLNLLCQEIAIALDQRTRSSLYGDSLGLTIAMRLLKLSSERSLFSWNTKIGRLAPWQIARVTEALDDQLTANPSLDHLADLVGLSKFHFARAFKGSTGLPPHRYLMQRRLQRARDLLEKTDLPITTIAAESGYDDPGYLARLFRNQFGITPAKYRRERRS